MAAFVNPAMPVPDRQRSAADGLSLNLSSNNPFRNRATSPSPLNSPFLETPSVNTNRPTSTNPFLDNAEFAANANAAHVNVPDDIFSELSIRDKRAVNNFSPPNPSLSAARKGSTPQVNYRPSGAGDRRPAPRPPRGPPSPVKHDARPPQLQRRASDSSVMEKDRQVRSDRNRPKERRERTESEERRRNERRKEREERYQKEKEKDMGRGSERRPRKPRGLDIIDKLDVTGVYGQGLFHHDGPFDACNPHRNARKDRRAPMQAFPAGSANMALGGAGPLNARLDLDRFHGRGEEGFSEYAKARKAETTIMDPHQRAEPVHGEETFGLGTSTFLEGAPASRRDLQRRDSEDPATEAGAGGLARKKSLAQRFRGMSTSRRNGPDVRSPDAIYKPGSSDLDSPLQVTGQHRTMSAGGPARAKYTKENEFNPFDNDYEAAFDKKGAQIRVAEQQRPAGERPQTSGGTKSSGSRIQEKEIYGQERGASGSSDDEERTNGANGGGFMKRMRSLKGGSRRPRNEA